MATIIDGKKRIPFMRGMLVHYLIERGFNHEDAREVANMVRESLGKVDDVRKKDLVQIVDKELRKKKEGRKKSAIWSSGSVSPLPLPLSAKVDRGPFPRNCSLIRYRLLVCHPTRVTRSHARSNRS